MPDLRRISETIPGTRPGVSGSPLTALRRNYRHRPSAGQPHPSEIVAALRAEIAARSPEHAALVAEWQAMQEGGTS